MRTMGPSDAYLERSRSSLRQYCDFCAACFVYNCDGSTALHNDIHLSVNEYFSRPEELDAKTTKNP